MQTLGQSAFVKQRPCSSLDTVSSLAVACDTDVASLKQINNLYSEHSLHSREHVFVPGGETCSELIDAVQLEAPLMFSCLYRVLTCPRAVHILDAVSELCSGLISIV